jgi:hypothetical protein
MKRNKEGGLEPCGVNRQQSNRTSLTQRLYRNLLRRARPNPNPVFHFLSQAIPGPLLESVDDSSTLKEGVDRGEGFLADLAEDRGSAPPEIVPVIDHYISRVRDVISLAWDLKLSRRELDASLLQVRLCYAQDLDRILQGLLLTRST